MDNNRAFSKSSAQQHFNESGNCIINLDLRQYFFYQSHHIQIHAPDGTHLESIGHLIKIDEIQSGTARLKEQVFLVECLLGNIIQELKLPAQASAAFADLLDRMQRVCGKYLK